MEDKAFARKLLHYLNTSPSPWHAAENAAALLAERGFAELDEREDWRLEKGGKYFFRRNGTALLAFVVGGESPARAGFRIVGAHTDMPAFRLKPGEAMLSPDGYVQLNTEPYGGMILNTWLDRPLSLAGRLVLRGQGPLGQAQRLVNLQKPLLMIPNLCIHFNRDVNEKGGLNRQTDMLPILCMKQEGLENKDFLPALLEREAGICPADILDYELFLYPWDKGVLMGPEEEFISARGLDNLSMAYCGLWALAGAKEAGPTQVLAVFDHEEVGSTTAVGANSGLLPDALARLGLALGCRGQDMYRARAASVCVSADVAHAVHPNHPQKHDPTCRPVLGGGPVIKYSAAQRYATTALTAGVFKLACERAQVPCQSFANRSDIPGGSTIGPAVSSHSSIPTVDVGTAILAMHSAREFGSAADNAHMAKAFRAFYEG